MALDICDRHLMKPMDRTICPNLTIRFYLGYHSSSSVLRFIQPPRALGQKNRDGDSHALEGNHSLLSETIPN